MLRYSVLCVLCSFLVGVLSDNKLNTQVKNAVSETNNYMAKNGLSELGLPEFKDKGKIHELRVYNTKVGNFSSAQVKEIPHINMTVIDGATMYSFQVILGLNPVQIHYDFTLEIESLMFPLNGKVQLASHTNSYEVRGTVLLKPDGTCKAVLEECKFIEMKDFEVNTKPKQITLMKQVKRYLLDAMSPDYLPRINLGLANLVEKKEFQEIFSKIVCSNVKK